MKTARNAAIVLVIALAIYLLPGGGRAATIFESLLYIGFGVGFGYLGLQLYRQHRVALYSLGDHTRALLYGGLALVLFALTARQRMWETSLHEALWWVLVAVAVYMLLAVYRRWRAY
ncbi:MAG TPA: hypothetical protein VEJ23_06260 [Solirubrobacteraceae bacterium]|nr:hypothetical protein [Solirubrobacteraceae bacterium]